MTFSPLTTRTIHTRNQGPRNAGARIDSIILHHAASANLEAILAMIGNATRQVSYNYIIGNAGQIVGIVPEQNRSWSVGNAAWDSRAITICHINERVGEPWPVSAAAHNASAELVADIHRRRGVPMNRTRIVGDRQIRATRCPGGLSMDDIVARAVRLVAGGSTPSPVQEEETDMPYPIFLDNRHLLVIGPGFISHLSTNTPIGGQATRNPPRGPADLTRDIITPAGAHNWIGLDAPNFLAQLDSFGIPREVVDVATGHVLDPSTGTRRAGGVWSWARVAAQNTTPAPNAATDTAQVS